MRVAAGLLFSGFLIGLLAQTPSVADGGVLNGASFVKGQAVAPGSLISIFGTNLATAAADADSIPLSTSLGNVSVTFNGISAPMLNVRTGQINAQLPWSIPAGQATVVVTVGSAKSAPAKLQVNTFAPGIFGVANAAGTLGIAYNAADFTLAWPVGIIPGLTTRPAKAGDVLTILATGLGPVDTPVQDGTNTLDKLRNVTTPPQLLVGGVAVDPKAILFAGLSPQFVGVNQVNFIVPTNTPAGTLQALQFQVGGVTSPASTVMAIAN